MRLWIGILTLWMLPTMAAGQTVVLGDVVELDPFEEPNRISKLRDRVIGFASIRLEQKGMTFEVIERQVIRVDREGDPSQWIQVTPLLIAAQNTQYSAEHKQTVRRHTDAWLDGWERRRDALWNADYAAIEPTLRITIGDETLSVGDDPVTCRPLNPHLHACLFVRLTGGDEFIRESLVAKWGADREAMLDRAIAQTTNGAKLTRVDRGNGLHRFSGRSWEHEASMLGLGPLLSEDARCGVVLSTRTNGFVVHRQEGPYDLMGPGRMVEEIAGPNGYFRGTVESAFHWVHEGVWTPYIVTASDLSITLRPPKALRACLESGAE